MNDYDDVVYLVKCVIVDVLPFSSVTFWEQNYVYNFYRVASSLVED